MKIRAVFVLLVLTVIVSCSAGREAQAQEVTTEEKRSALLDAGFSEEALALCHPDMIEDVYEACEGRGARVLFSRRETGLRRTREQSSEPVPDVFATLVLLSDREEETAVSEALLFINYAWKKPPLLWGQDAVEVRWDRARLASGFIDEDWLYAATYADTDAGSAPVYTGTYERAELLTDTAAFPVVLKGNGKMRPVLNGYVRMTFKPLYPMSVGREAELPDVGAIRVCYDRRSLGYKAVEEYSLYLNGTTRTSLLRMKESYAFFGCLLCLIAGVSVWLITRGRPAPLFPREGGQSAAAASVKQGSSFVESIVSHLENHLEEPFQMADLAQEVGYSIEHTRKRFRKEYGKSITDTLQELRIDKAMEYLERDDMSVEQIAARLCFASSGYFARVFRKYTGVTPMAYKKLKRSEKRPISDKEET
ncbi:MAG: helix-turn-helix transcriptional regulator [Lachnospiraceae bacterium]|nr:helix-turn-helix transcriptional regulator [Lachnospiraceae bacterium]